MHQSLRRKVLLWFLVVAAALGAAGWIGYAQLSHHILAEAQDQAESRLSHVIDMLEATDNTPTPAWLALPCSCCETNRSAAANLGWKPFPARRSRN